MKLRFLWVGKTRNSSYKTLQEDYLQRLSHFTRTEVIEVRDHSGPDQVSIEGKRLLEKLNPTSIVCLLDVTGTSITSQQLAAKLETWQNEGTKELTLIIGGAEGVSAEVAHRADIRLSLSFLTLTHEMARVVLLEQIYRAFTIIKGYPYQK